jgi:CheY-like chemotaxis protein
MVIRKSLTRALTKLGFDVRASINGLDGLKELKSDVFDVVLCDFLMPVMDGLDCVKQFRDWEAIHRPWIRQYIVGISAHASAKDLEKGLAAGMDDFKAKPVTLKMLKELESSNEVKRVSDAIDSLPVRSLLGLDDCVTGGRPLEDAKLPSKKRIKVDDDDDTAPSGPVCLIGEDASHVRKTMATIVESKFWNPVVVNDGEDALRLLKMRNWDAVFLGEEMPRLDGTRVIERFREWEKEHRVARQRNVFLISASVVPPPSSAGGSVSAAYPAGFDGALGKPVLPVVLGKLLDSAALRIAESSTSMDIVAR